MSDDALLSDLCSICNTNRYKYRCPGCSARTCSLPCYKRHQQWAQCSGQRDPTKFVKKSQLVTPAGIDHDFNFLTGIERDIEKAEKGLNEGQDVGIEGSRSWSQSQSQKQTNYQHLEAAGVKVIRAPKGLSRQKENKSHRSNTKKATGSKNIMWTVEWLDDQKRRILTETSSTAQIAVAQPFAAQEPQKVRKRKRDFDRLLATTALNIQDVTYTPEIQDKSVEVEVEVDTNLNITTQDREHLPTRRVSTDANEEKTEETKTRSTEAKSSNHVYDGACIRSMGDGEYLFFLLKPRTSSSRRVLIPLISTTTLGECLNGRTVLEFPTIYVFPSSVQHLPVDFMLEEDYLKQEGEEQKEFDELISELDPEILKRLRDDGRQSSARQDRKAEEVDSREILDVLKKDFGAVM